MVASVKHQKIYCRATTYGVVPNAFASRKAVSAVTPLCALASRSIRIRGTAQALALAPADIPIGTCEHCAANLAPSAPTLRTTGGGMRLIAFVGTESPINVWLQPRLPG
jgi:hypothetical protein